MTSPASPLAVDTAAPLPSAAAPAGGRRLVYVVTEDWAFWRHRLPMARAARAAGFEVHVIANVKGRAHVIEREGFVLHHMDMKRGSTSVIGLAAAGLRLRRLIRSIDPALVHNVAMKPLITGMIATIGMPRIAVVNSINGLGSAFISSTAYGRFLRWGLRRLISRLCNRHGTRTIVQNADDFAAVAGIGVGPEKLVLVPGSGVDCDVFQPLSEPPGEPVRMAFVGRLLRDKGLDWLVEAHRLVRERGGNLELLLAGEPDEENPTSITRADLVAWSGLPGVRLLGHVEDISTVWAQAHIAVLPSRGEGLPKCMLEAAACGRPMIATDVAGCREVVIDGETGLLVPPGDNERLADAIQALASDPEARRRFGAAARRLALARFSADDIGAQTVAVYEGVIKSVGAGARRS